MPKQIVVDPGEDLWPRSPARAPLTGQFRGSQGKRDTDHEGSGPWGITLEALATVPMSASLPTPGPDRSIPSARGVHFEQEDEEDQGASPNPHPAEHDAIGSIDGLELTREKRFGLPRSVGSEYESAPTRTTPAVP
jgi:hypothetical protein